MRKRARAVAVAKAAARCARSLAFVRIARCGSPLC